MNIKSIEFIIEILEKKFAVKLDKFKTEESNEYMNANIGNTPYTKEEIQKDLTIGYEDEIIPEKSVKNDYLIILFVDGSLYPEYIKRIAESGEYYCSDSKNFVTIDAKDGVRSNKNSLEHLKKISERVNEPYVVYTNSIIALNNEYSWNETMQRPEIYLNYNTYKSFTTAIEVFQNITSVTSKALRKEHNIAKMYFAGAFK